MANIAEITNAASYRGDPNLALGGGLVLDIDTKPFQQLAQYTFLYHKSLFDQRQKDADEKIKQLAGLTAYDLVDGIEKDKTELIDAQAKLTDRMSKEAALGTPKSPKEKMEREVAFQKDIKDQIKLINAANARKIKLDTYIGSVQKLDNITAQEKELRINQAKKLFNDTDIYTLPEIPNHDLTIPKNGDPVIDKVSVLKNDKSGNAVISETIDQFSIGNTWKNAYLHGNNLFAPTPPPADATQQQKDEYQQKKLAFEKTSLGGWKSATDFYNAAFNDPNYKKIITTTDINVVGAPAVTSLTNEIDTDKIKADNPIIGGILSVAERYNKYAEKRLADIKNGYYIDDVTGEKVLLVGGDKAEDIKFIDVTKPLKPEDISFLEMFARAKPDEVDKKFIPTDNAIQRENNLLDYKVAWHNANKASGSGKAPDLIEKPAILFGQHIDRLKKDFNNGKTEITVTYEGTDPKTRIALGMDSGDKTVYNADGSYKIVTKKGRTKTTGTIENLAQGFIEAVKTTDIDPTKDKDGTMAAGFQQNSEANFNRVFGTTNGKTIWDNWEKGTSKSQQSNTKSIKAATIKSLVGKKGYEGYTEQEIIDYYKSNGYDIKD